jgi:hypothetical protein
VRDRADERSSSRANEAFEEVEIRGRASAFLWRAHAVIVPGRTCVADEARRIAAGLMADWASLPAAVILVIVPSATWRPGHRGPLHRRKFRQWRSPSVTSDLLAVIWMAVTTGLS